MTPKERAAMQQALEALEVSTDWDVGAKGKQLQSMKAITALRKALAEQAEQEPVAQQDSDDRRLLREIFMLCEATEELEPTNDFMRGRIFEAKGIRRGIGNWYQDTFCGRSYMGEPVLNAAPVQQAEQEPVGHLCEASFGRGQVFWFNKPADNTPLYASPVRTKDLTDDELRQVLDRNCGDGLMAIARAVIAADREKNK